MAIWVEHTLDVDGVKRRTPADLFRRWKAFKRVCPFGDEWKRTAAVVKAIAAGKGVQITDDEIIPRYRPQADDDALADQLLTWANQHNARIKAEENGNANAGR